MADAVKGGRAPSGVTPRSPIVAALLSWFAIGLAYIATAPGNRSEADDAFAFADAVENVSWRELISSAHTPHLLFLPTWRGIVDIARPLGIDASAYDVIRPVDSFAAAAAVVMFFLILRRRFEISLLASVAAAACFGASYGFWRYANEGDVYPFAAAAVLVYCWFALDAAVDTRIAVLAGIAAAFAILVHILGFIPAVTVAPVVFLERRAIRSLAIYATTAVLTVFVVTFVAFLLAGASVGSYPRYVLGTGVTSYSDVPRSALKSIVGFAPDMSGADFVFRYPEITSRLKDRVPTVDLREEIFAATHAPAGLAAAGLVLLVATISLGLVLAVRSLRGPPLHDGRVLALVAWIVLYWIVVIGRTPAAPESWIPLLTPVWILVGVLVFARVRGRWANRAVVGFVVVFIAQSAIGGMAVVRPARWDLNARRASWLEANARPGDTILSEDGPIFDWYLAYHTAADVLPLTFMSQEQLESTYAALASRPGAVYATDTVLDPPPEYAAQDPAGYAAVVAFAAQVRGDFLPVYRDETGTVFVRPP